MRVFAGLKRILKLLVIVYIIMLIGLYFGQRSLIYKPHGIAKAPAEYGLANYDAVTLETKDSQKLKAWYSKPKDAKNVIIFFGGNADVISNYINFYKQLRAADIAVLAVCYRGYCGTDGSPTEQGLYADADAALEFVRKDFEDSQIIAVGRSLGTGVATNLAHKNELGGLVLVSPYTSIPDVAADIYWYMPVRLFVHDKFASIDKIAAVSGDLLIIHGDQDKLIPVSQGLALYAAAQTSKKMAIYEGIAHNNVPFKHVGEDIIEFFSRDGVQLVQR